MKKGVRESGEVRKGIVLLVEGKWKGRGRKNRRKGGVEWW